MIDLLVLAGVALCVISVVMAIVSVVRTQAPRGAAVALVLGIIALFVASYADERPFGAASIVESWHRVTGGNAFGTDTVTAPPPAITDEQVDPDPNADAQPQPPAVEEPAVEAPATGTSPSQ